MVSKSKLVAQDGEQWVAFCDGACSGNPGPGGWGAVVWNSETDLVYELGGALNPTTNNQMELTAAIEVLTFIQGRGGSEDPVHIASDSSYMIKGLTEWVPNWKKRNWQKVDGQSVMNQEFWKKLDAVAAKFPKLYFHQILGHSGNPENERADQIAVAFSQGAENFKLYSGARLQHPDTIFKGITAQDIRPWIESGQAKASSAPRPKKSKATRAPGSYYISVLDGKLERHNDWGSCETRVKGKSGAKFKKVKNASEESEFLSKHRIKTED
jgi:ribonuclease HI